MYRSVTSAIAQYEVLENERFFYEGVGQIAIEIKQ